MDSPSTSASIPFSVKISPENNSSTDPRLLLSNLSMLQQRMESLQLFLYENVQKKTLIGRDQMDLVSNEISSAVQQVIMNGIALLSCYSQDDPQPNQIAKPAISGSSSSIEMSNKKQRVKNEIDDGDFEIVELNAEELLAENIHRCEICGKGFKRGANLRMHKRAHGNQFKTLEALMTSPESDYRNLKKNTRFSCPFVGCSRNKSYIAFKPLKSEICLKNHFKRSHCAKMFSCNRCNKKSFSLVADLKSHQKNCRKFKWRCSCGWSFPKKDKLFRHMEVFHGDHHMVNVFVADQEDSESEGVAKNKRTVSRKAEQDEDDEWLAYQDNEKEVEEVKSSPNYSRDDEWLAYQDNEKEVEEVKSSPNYSRDDEMLFDEMLQLGSFEGIIRGQECFSSNTSTSDDSVSVSVLLPGMDEFQGIWCSDPSSLVSTGFFLLNM